MRVRMPPRNHIPTQRNLRGHFLKAREKVYSHWSGILRSLHHGVYLFLYEHPSSRICFNCRTLALRIPSSDSFVFSADFSFQATPPVHHKVSFIFSGRSSLLTFESHFFTPIPLAGRYVHRERRKATARSEYSTKLR
jgi:hypothetical protein